MPTISAISVMPARANLICSVRMCATRYPTSALTTIAMPPIVGVPAFAACGCAKGPSSRICWPMPLRLQHRGSAAACRGCSARTRRPCRRAARSRASRLLLPGAHSQGGGHQLEADRPAALHQHRVAGADAAARARRARRRRRAPRSRRDARGARRGGERRRFGVPTTTSTSTRSRRRRRRRCAACSSLAQLTELAHLAEHGDPPSGHVDPCERVAAPRPSTSGLALYASSSTTTPDRCCAHLHAPRRRAARWRGRRRRRRTARRARARPPRRAWRSRPGARRGRRARPGRSPTATRAGTTGAARRRARRRRPHVGGGVAAPTTSRTRRVGARREPGGRGVVGVEHRRDRRAASASSSSPFTRATPARPPRRPGVREADVGDHADRRAGDRAQRGDVAGNACAHLEHERLGARAAPRAA